MNKIEKVISDYKKSSEFDNKRKMWEARGGMKFADEIFQSLTDKQRLDIISGVGVSYGFTVNNWWKGMIITERKEALINLLKIND